MRRVLWGICFVCLSSIFLLRYHITFSNWAFLTAKSKKLRRKAAKQQRKLEAQMLASGDMSALQPKIPLTQQSIDLPGNEEGTIEGALEADSRRQELRAALREERRKSIKEANYLKSM
jgi:large subunit ribosomal protein L54